jgi:hypothetical protein
MSVGVNQSQSVGSLQGKQDLDESVERKTNT